MNPMKKRNGFHPQLLAELKIRLRELTDLSKMETKMSDFTTKASKIRRLKLHYAIEDAEKDITFLEKRASQLKTTMKNTRLKISTADIGFSKRNKFNEIDPVSMHKRFPRAPKRFSRLKSPKAVKPRLSTSTPGKSPKSKQKCRIPAVKSRIRTLSPKKKKIVTDVVRAKTPKHEIKMLFIEDGYDNEWDMDGGQDEAVNWS